MTVKGKRDIKRKLNLNSHAKETGNVKMKTMKYIMILLIVISITSCGIDNKETENKESIKFKVEYKGALKNMMHKGDISSKADLSAFENTEHFYALGAIENLKGEIQIFDSKPFNTMVIDSSLKFDNSFNKKATLLVYASVSKWKSFDWHVINWRDGDTVHSHEKHISSGLHSTINNTQVDMLGFYSNSHHAIFTHHSTNMHIHVKTVDNKIAGHVDGLTLGKGMTLKLPDIK